MRVIVRSLLRKYKSPPDQQPKALELIMEQAMLFGEDWAIIKLSYRNLHSKFIQFI